MVETPTTLFLPLTDRTWHCPLLLTLSVTGESPRRSLFIRHPEFVRDFPHVGEYGEPHDQAHVRRVAPL